MTSDGTSFNYFPVNQLNKLVQFKQTSSELWQHFVSIAAQASANAAMDVAAQPITPTNGLWTPQSAARQTHPCPSQPHYDLHPACSPATTSYLSSKYYQGWKAELA